MKKHVLLTGEIQIGKSTAIRRFLERGGAEADGFLTRFASSGERRELYLYRFDTAMGETEGRLAARLLGGRPEVFAEAFNTHGARILREAGARDLIVIDELGVFEECAPEFKAAVFERLSGDIPVLGVVKKRLSPFLDAVRSHPDVEVITVTEENRDAIPEILRERYY